MRARVEITARYGTAYNKVSKVDKGRILDEVVSVTAGSVSAPTGCLTYIARI